MGGDILFEVEAIVAIVERGRGDKVVNLSREKGATGGTVVYARGSSDTETKKLLNVYISATKEMVIILCEKHKIKPIMDAIVESENLKQPGTGIIFTVPVSNVIGLHHRED